MSSLDLSRPAKCEGCGRAKADKSINLLNGHLFLCNLCCGELNAKSPLLIEAQARIAELEARLATVAADMRWQPIETAPKDGTMLLLWWPKARRNGHVMGRFGEYLPDSWSEEIVEYRWKTSNGIAWPEDPTHWLPLPPPPSVQ